MKLKIMMLALIATVGLVACGGSDDNSAAAEIAKLDTSAPDGALKASLAALKANDIKALIKSQLNEESYNNLVSAFEANKTTDIPESDKAQFAQTVAMLTADGAEEQLYQQVVPQLEQAKAMVPMMLMMGKDQMLQGIKNNPMIPEGQRETITQVASAAMDWVGENDLFSEDKTRGAIAAVVATAKALDMKSLDEVQNMSFDQALDKGSIALGGLKDVLNVYGLSMDDMLDSVEVSDVNVDGDKATMNVSYDVFGQTLSQPMEMMKVDGVWVGKQ